MRFRALRVLAVMGLATGILAVGSASASAGVNDREATQRQRIRAGVKDGSLTHREAHRLAHRQVRLERKERAFRRNDGHLGPRERRNLNRSLNRSSRQIYRARHNERER